MTLRFPVRDDDIPPRRYRTVSGVLRWAVRAGVVGGFVLEGAENVPAAGPLLVATNHLSNLDPVVFGAFFPRTLFAMAKREMFRGPLLTWLFTGCNAFPVERGGADRQALRTALELLQDGRRLLLFIEGTRSRSGSMSRALPGAGFIARRSGVPVLPVAVWGTERVLERKGWRFRRGRLHMRCGEAFHPAIAGGRGADQAVADEIAARIAGLLPERYRGSGIAAFGLE